MSLMQLLYADNFSYLRVRLINLVNSAYELVFREKISEELQKLAKDIAYLLFGTVLSYLFILPFNIFSARILGPSEYGKFAIIQSVAMFLYVPMILGFNTASIKYISQYHDLDNSKKLISTAYILVISLISVSTSVYLLFSVQLSKIFSVSQEIFHMSIIFAAFFVFYLISTSILKGLLKIKLLSIFQLIYSIILCLVFISFLLFDIKTFESLLLPYYFAYGLIGVITLILIRKYLIPKFDLSWAKIMSKYAIFASIGGISFIVYTNIDKILINKYLSSTDLGIYAAYYFSSFTLSSLIITVLNTIIFPYASKVENKRLIFEKIDKLTPYLFYLGIPMIFVLEYIFIRFYGNSFPVIYPLMLMFATASSLSIYYGTYDWLFCSEGTRGVKLINISTITIAILNVIFNFYFTPIFGLYGAISSYIIAFICGICIMSHFKKRL